MKALTNRIRISVAAVKIGDYVSFGGHRLQEHLCNQWWKVQAIEGVTLALVDKAGRRARVACNSYSAIKVYRWSPVSAAN